MSVFEQTHSVRIDDIKFDDEFVLRFISIDGREVFKAHNLPSNILPDLVLEAKINIRCPFHIEYKTDTLKTPLYIGLDGFCIEPFRFNTRYSKRSSIGKKGMVYRLGDTVGLIIKKHMQAHNKQTRRFVQSCVLREFFPNHWVRDENCALTMHDQICDHQVVNINDIELEQREAVRLSLVDRLEIQDSLSKKFPVYVGRSIGALKPRKKNTDVQSSFYLPHKFVFRNKSYANWCDAFIDHIKNAEKMFDGKPRPRIQTHIENQNELNRVIKKIQKLENRNIRLIHLESLTSNMQEKAQYKTEITKNTEDLSGLRLKRKEMNIRSDRQLQLLEDKYLFCKSKKSQLIKKNFAADIDFLVNLRNNLLKQKQRNQLFHADMNKKIKVNFEGLRVNGEVAVQGTFDFVCDSHFINKMYSKNISAFEGVVKIMFFMPDGKRIYHTPSYIDDNQKRVDTNGLLIHFDQNVFDWLISQEQTRQNMIIQAVLNQHHKVSGVQHD